MMYAVEFESKINNGILKIPSKYKQIADSDKVKVIILVENEKEKKIDAEFMHLQFGSMKSTWNNDEDEAWNEL